MTTADSGADGPGTGLAAVPISVQACDDYVQTLSSWPKERGPTLLWAPRRSPLWIGPVVGPGAVCALCLYRRLSANAPAVDRAWGPWSAGDTMPHDDETAPSATADAALRAYLDAMAARATRARQLWTVYSDRTFRHESPSDASCPACGDPGWWARASATAPQWAAGRKAPGGHRIRTADESWTLLRRHVSPLTGVVTRLSGGASGPLAGWGARHPAGSSTVVMRTGGKGIDSAAARVAAVCEAVERTALTWPDTGIPVVKASLAELSERAIDPRDVMLFSAAQYSAASGNIVDDRASAHQRTAQQPSDAVIRHRVPVPLRDDDELAWVHAFPLTASTLAEPGSPASDSEPHLVPAALVWFSHQAEVDDTAFDRLRIVADSNGVAAGATSTEAAVYGLLEIIERDAVAMWWHLRLPRPALDLSTVDDSYLRDMAAHAERHGRDLWLLDLTNDIGVPVVAAVCPQKDGSEIVFGFGAHLDPVAAARSAVAECAQFLMSFAHFPDDRHGLFGEPGRRWWGTRTLATDPYLRPVPGTAPVPWPPDTSGETDLDDLRALVDRLGAAGLSAYAVPMSRPDVPEVAVIRMIVPTARSMFPRYAPGRLFDVPHRLSWPAGPTTGAPGRPLTEADLNPEEIFF